MHEHHNGTSNEINVTIGPRQISVRYVQILMLSIGMICSVIVSKQMISGTVLKLLFGQLVICTYRKNLLITRTNINHVISSNSCVAPLSSDDSPHLFTSDSDKTRLLYDFFKSAFTVDNGILPNFPSRLTSPDITISDLYITPKLIKLILRKLKINSAAGPDGLPPIFLQ